jgi:hypothetical protein
MLNLSHKKLIVWNYALELVELIYSLTKNFPKSESFGLTIQLRRASISVISHYQKDFLDILKLKNADSWKLQGLH